MLACFAWICLACQAPEARVPEERAPVMTLEVVRSPGSPTNLLIRVRNGADAPVWWNARALLNAPHAPATFRELWLEVTADRRHRGTLQLQGERGEGEGGGLRAARPRRRA